MVEKIAYRVSASILLLTGLAIVAMLVMGLTRADAGSSSQRTTEAVADSAAPEAVVENVSVAGPIAEQPAEIVDKLR